MLYGTATAWLLACALVAGAASAQANKDAPEAKRHYEVAEKLYAQAQYEPALSEYLTSYKLDATKRSPLRNAADCQRKLNRFADAYESYARLLEAHGAKLKPAERKAIERELAELGQLTGAIEVVVNEAGAEVAVDGAAIGSSPLARAKRVSIAKHKVRVTKPGFDPFEADVEIASMSAVKVSVELRPESALGRLSVREQSGKPVHVLVDGKDVGPAPWEGELPPGDHTLELKGDKLSAEKRTITIARKEAAQVVLAAESSVGQLRVTATPVTAQITVDGKPVGNGAWEADVEPGVHQIEVALGEAIARREVTIRRGESMTQEVPLVVGPVVAPPEYTGLYGGFTLGFGVWLTPPKVGLHFNSTTEAGGAESAGIPQSIPLTMRIGYAFRYLAVEFVGTLTVMHENEHFQVPTALANTGTVGSSYSTDAVGVSGFFGVGPRYATKTEPVRFTASIAPGVVVRMINFNDNYNNGNNSNGSCPNGCQQMSFGPTTSWVAPGLHADLGLMFGSTPGAKFLLGAEVWADFPHTIVIGPDNQSPLPSDVFPRSDRSFVLAKSPEVFVGPTLGVQWGH
jgi:hypothetical protein